METGNQLWKGIIDNIAIEVQPPPAERAAHQAQHHRQTGRLPIATRTSSSMSAVTASNTSPIAVPPVMTAGPAQQDHCEFAVEFQVEDHQRHDNENDEAAGPTGKMDGEMDGEKDDRQRGGTACGTKN